MYTWLTILGVDMDTWSPEEIKKLRKRLSLTQEAFGLLVGVTRVYVNNLEKGVKKPSKTLRILLSCISNRATRKRKGG